LMCFNFQENRMAGGKVCSLNHGGLCCVLDGCVTG
jgi:hypothetical protein